MGICHLCGVPNVHCTVHICAKGNKRRIGEVQWGKRRVGGRGRGGAEVEAIVGAVHVSTCGKSSTSEGSTSESTSENTSESSTGEGSIVVRAVLERTLVRAVQVRAVLVRTVQVRAAAGAERSRGLGIAQ